MSDQEEMPPSTIPVISTDIISSGPIERGVTLRPDVDHEERANLFKAMAAEADRQLKATEARALRAEARLRDVEMMAQRADNELAMGERPGVGINRYVANARAILTRMLEVLR